MFHGEAFSPVHTLLQAAANAGSRLPTDAAGDPYQSQHVKDMLRSLRDMFWPYMYHDGRRMQQELTIGDTENMYSNLMAAVHYADRLHALLGDDTFRPISEHPVHPSEANFADAFIRGSHRIMQMIRPGRPGTLRQFVDPTYGEHVGRHWPADIFNSIAIIVNEGRAAHHADGDASAIVGAAACASCNRVGANLRCGSCAERPYCSLRCAEADWATHVHECGH